MVIKKLEGVRVYERSLSYSSILFDVFSAILVLPYRKNSTITNYYFCILDLIVGFIEMRDMKGMSLVGIILSTASLIYLIILFVGLGS